MVASGEIQTYIEVQPFSQFLQVGALDVTGFKRGPGKGNGTVMRWCPHDPSRDAIGAGALWRPLECSACTAELAGSSLSLSRCGLVTPQ